MTTPERVLVVCFATALLLLNKPLGRMTAAWQRMMGLGTAAHENTNRIFFIAGGVIFLVVAFWAN